MLGYIFVANRRKHLKTLITASIRPHSPPPHQSQKNKK